MTGSCPTRSTIPARTRLAASTPSAPRSPRSAAPRSAPRPPRRCAPLITGFDLDRVLAALPRAEARLANVDRLVAIAARARRLARRLRALARSPHRDEADEAEAVVFAEDDDAVRLLTIHGSKGLDFQVVVLVDLAAEPRPAYPGIDLVPPQGEREAALLVRHFAPLEPEKNGEPAPLLQLPTPALRAAQAESRAREQAERRRLTYVAITRARDGLVLVAPTTKPRGSSAWRTLSEVLPSEARATISRCERAADLLRGRLPHLNAAAPEPAPSPAFRIAPLAPAPALFQASPAIVPPSSSHEPSAISTKPGAAARTIALATTAMSLFHGCARRYRLRYLLGFDEPLASTQFDLFAGGVVEEGEAAEVAGSGEEDARDVGRAAHRVLERWPAVRWGVAVAPDEIADRLVCRGDRACLAGARAARRGHRAVPGWALCARVVRCGIELSARGAVRARGAGGGLARAAWGDGSGGALAGAAHRCDRLQTLAPAGHARCVHIPASCVRIGSGATVSRSHGARRGGVPRDRRGAALARG